MTSFPKYERYKDSGVEWLGEIPEHWEVRRNLGVFDERNERGRPNDELLSVTIKRGVIRQSEITTKKDSSNEDKSKYKVLKEGDLAYNKMRAWQGALGISPYDGIVSPAYIILQPKNPKLSKYFHYLYRTPQFITEANRLSYGLCDDMNSLRYDDFKGSHSPLPPDDEVDRIVTFLDRKTAEIDALIAKKQRQIQLLDEQKTILINRAVTRGIVNAEFGMKNEHLSSSSHSTFTTHNSKFKPSGVPWIGDVPEHWEAVQLRRIIDGIEQGVSPATIEGEVTENDWGVLKSGCCNGGAFRETEHKRLPTNFKLDPNIAVKSGDLLVSRACGSRDLVGSTAMVETVSFNLILSDKNFRLLPRPIVDRRFLNYSMNSFHYRRQLDPRISGADGLPNNIPGARLKEIVIALPPLAEQRALVEYLSDVFDKTAKGVASAESHIQSLKTLRSTLIAHAVTGRIKV
jgi:type I restriction enzyme S subunit